MINKRKIKKYKLINYMYNQGAITIKGFNQILKELNLNDDELKILK